MSRRKRMPFLDVLARWESFSFLRDAMNETGPAHILDRRESIHQRVDVVTVDRPEVSKPELFEENSWSEERLYALLPLPHQGANSGKRARRGIDHCSDRRADAIVERIPLNRGQILRHRPHVWGDRHLVVVENDDEVALGRTRVVEAFVRQPAGQCSIAKNRDDLEVLAIQIASDRNSVARGNRRARVSRAEGVVLALGALQKSGQPVLLAQSLESVSASSEEFVRVALMPHIPDNPVPRRIEHRVQRHGQLDHSKAGANVSTGSRTSLDEANAHLVGDGAQLVARHRLGIRGGGGSVEDGHFGRGRQDVRVTMKLATCESSCVSSFCSARLSRPSAIRVCALWRAPSTPSSAG